MTLWEGVPEKTFPMCMKIKYPKYDFLAGRKEACIKDKLCSGYSQIWKHRQSSDFKKNNSFKNILNILEVILYG